MYYYIVCRSASEGTSWSTLLLTFQAYKSKEERTKILSRSVRGAAARVSAGAREPAVRARESNRLSAPHFTVRIKL
jgi:hypothetical protein